MFAFWVDIVPNPNVVLWVDASASSSNALPAVVKSNTAAVPDPVNWIPLSAAEVNPAIALRSASNACTFVPIAKPKLVLAVDADDTSDKLFEAVSLVPSCVWIALVTPDT